MGLLLIGLFFLFLIMGIPIVFAMGVSALFVLIFSETPLLIIIQRLFSGSNSFLLTAIPFFILAGNLMSAGGITGRLIGFAQCLVGHLRGGLAFVNIIASMIFGGVSGSATADTAAIGSILIPAMEREGYDREFSGAVTAGSATLGVVIPPSIIMILYGVLAGESIGKLFLGGIIPGFMVGVGMMVPTYFISKKKNYPKQPRVPFRALLEYFFKTFHAILMPVVIIWGIVGGVVTPTEAGVLAVLYAAVAGFFVYRELHIKDLPGIFMNTVITSASIMLIMAVADIFGWLVASLEIPKQFCDFFLGISENKYLILLLINLFLLIIGTFIDTGAALIITVPILLPLAKTFGFDPIHFGLIITINLGIGLFTPPVGTNLYICCATARIGLHEISVSIIPFIISAVIVLLIVSYIPESVLFIPSLLMK